MLWGVNALLRGDATNSIVSILLSSLNEKWLGLCGASAGGSDLQQRATCYVVVVTRARCVSCFCVCVGSWPSRIISWTALERAHCGAPRDGEQFFVFNWY